MYCSRGHIRKRYTRGSFDDSLGNNSATGSVTIETVIS
jgi:hypothetical protein